MAVWFMDDGSKSRSALYLNTQQFDVENQQLLLWLLKDQWEIVGALNRDKSYHRIRMSVGSSIRFAELIAPYVLPEFRYKFPK